MRIGIIGCGLIGLKRANLLNKKHIKIVSDVSLSKLKVFENKFNCAITQNYEDVINTNIDIIFICTPHYLLSKLAIDSLKKKKHVFIEKPGTINTADLKVIKSLSKKNNLCVKIGFNHRYHPSMILSKKIINQNKLGQILFLKGSYGHGGRKNYNTEWRFDIAKSGGGELIDQGSHLIDLAVFFLDDVKLDYAVLGDFFWKKGVDDNVFISLKSQNNQIAWLNASWTEWKNSFNFEIICKKGKIQISGLGKSYGTETLKLYKMNKNLTPPKEKIYVFDQTDNSWKIEIDDFFKSIKNKNFKNKDLDQLSVISKIIYQAYKANKKNINFNYQ